MRRSLVAAVLTTGLLAPMYAHAAGPQEVPPAAASRNSEVTAQAPAIPQEAPDPGATAVPEATEVEKIKAVRAIEVGEATDEWLMLSDKNFVFRVYDRINPDKYPLTKAEAYRVYKIVVDKPDAPDATAFIRTGIHDFVDRDHIEYARRQEEARQARDARQKAAAFAEIPADAAMLDGNDQNFVYQVWRRSTGPKVKDGAGTAWGGDATTWKTFITTTIFTLHLQDQRDAIDEARKESEQKARELAAKQAKKNAAAVLGIVAPDGWLVLSDDNFIRQLLATPELADPRHSEVRTAADAALRGTPADWAAFIDTGLKAADGRDAKREQDIREEADRKKVRDIKAKAEASLMRPRLVAAANAALAGTYADVVKFLAETQYATLTQSLMATTPETAAKGWYVRSGGGDAWITPGTQSDTVADAPLGEASWKVVPGLADANCFSFESTTHVGSYLRHQSYRVKLHASDGSEVFNKDATWCAKPGLAGSGVSLESKNVPGRYLRHANAELWLANDSGQFAWDYPGGFKQDATWNVADPDPLVTTQIMLRWLNDDGWRVFAGGPKAAEVLVDGIRYREFVNNTRAYWGKDTGVRSVSGAALTKYLASGGHTLRMPIQDTTATPDGIGTFTHFAGGLSIYASRHTDAHLVYGAIRDHWQNLGWERSYLGYPTSDEEQVGILRRSTFQGGYIYHDPKAKKTWDTKF